MTKPSDTRTAGRRPRNASEELPTQLTGRDPKPKAKPDPLLRKVQTAKADELYQIAQQGERQTKLVRAEVERRIHRYDAKLREQALGERVAG